MRSLFNWLSAVRQLSGQARPHFSSVCDRPVQISSSFGWSSEIEQFRADLQWWALFLDSWNGVAIISALCRRPVDTKLSMDASGSWGCGAYFGNQWFALPWSSCPSWAEVHVSVQELLPIVISCAIWGSETERCHIHSSCDNAAIVVIINKHTSNNPMIMHLLHYLFFMCAKFNIALSAEHIAGVRNEAADALSRNNFPAFFQKIPAAHKVPSDTPQL